MGFTVRDGVACSLLWRDCWKHIMILYSEMACLTDRPQHSTWGLISTHAARLRNISVTAAPEPRCMAQHKLQCFVPQSRGPIRRSVQTACQSSSGWLLSPSSIAWRLSQHTDLVHNFHPDLAGVQVRQEA